MYEKPWPWKDGMEPEDVWQFTFALLLLLYEIIDLMQKEQPRQFELYRARAISADTMREFIHARWGYTLYGCETHPIFLAMLHVIDTNCNPATCSCPEMRKVRREFSLEHPVKSLFQ